MRQAAILLMALMDNLMDIGTRQAYADALEDGGFYEAAELQRHILWYLQSGLAGTNTLYQTMKEKGVDWEAGHTPEAISDQLRKLRRGE